MSRPATFTLVFVFSNILTYLPGVYATPFSVFKVSPDNDGHTHYEETLDTFTVMSVLECARVCSRNSRCSGYKFLESNGTCNTREFVTNLPSQEDLVQSEFTSYRKIVCDEAPDVPGAHKVTEGQFLGAVATYTCIPDFKLCLNRTSSVCQRSGQWEDLTGLCGQFRWQNPKREIDYYLPCGSHSTFAVTVLATPATEHGSSVNIASQEGITLHAVFIPNSDSGTGTFDFTSRWSTTYWVPGEQSSVLIPLEEELEIIVTVDNGEYEIRVNGILIHTYNSPLNNEPPDFIVFWLLSPHLLEIGL